MKHKYYKIAAVGIMLAMLVAAKWFLVGFWIGRNSKAPVDN